MLKRLAFSFFALFWASVAVASGITSPSNYNAANVAITGGSIAGVSISTGAGAAFGTVRSVLGYKLGTGSGKDLIIFTPPTIASGFGTGASIVPANGTAAFLVHIGTTLADTGVLTFPAAENGWICNGTDTSDTVFTGLMHFTPVSTTSVKVTNWGTGSAALRNWDAGAVLGIMCTGY